MVAQVRPGEAKSLLDLMGNMTLPESSLAKLPRKFNEQWEQHREPFEYLLRESIKVPEEAVTVAASLDGLLFPMKDGKRQEKREKINPRASEPVLQLVVRRPVVGPCRFTMFRVNACQPPEWGGCLKARKPL